MDEKIRQAIADAVKRETFAQALNMKLVELEDGHSVVEMVYDPETMDNMYNRAHGGALFGLIDEAFETAAQTKGTIAVALNVNITYVTSPQPGSTLRAEAIQVSQTKPVSQQLRWRVCTEPRMGMSSGGVRGPPSPHVTAAAVCRICDKPASRASDGFGLAGPSLVGIRFPTRAGRASTRPSARALLGGAAGPFGQHPGRGLVASSGKVE